MGVIKQRWYCEYGWWKVEGTFILYVFKQVKDEQHGCSNANIDRLQHRDAQEEEEASASGVCESNENGLAEPVFISSGGAG